MRRIIAVLAISAIILSAGCAGAPQPPQQNNSTPPFPPVKNNTTLANPASSNCVDAGYRVDMREEKGGQAGYCIFKNGRECEEWAFFRGECTDADSFTMVESPGFAIDPKEVAYRFSSDGLLTISEKQLRNGSASTLTAWLSPSDFAAFIKSISSYGYGSLEASYASCSGGNFGCPSDMPSITLTLRRQGGEQQVYLYGSADHPPALDMAILEFKSLIEENAFVQADVSGCQLMQNLNSGMLACAGCPAGITNPKCNALAADYAPVQDSDGLLGSCTVDAEGACAYRPPAQMAAQLCKSAGGNWNECGSACRGAPEGTACTLQCVPYCECGGFAGFSCPSGFFCTDYLPPGPEVADAMGICKPVQ